MQDIDDFVESLRKPKKVKNVDKEVKTTKSSTKKVKRKAKVKQEKTVLRSTAIR